MTFDPAYYTGSVKSGSEELNAINEHPTPEALREYITNEMQTADEVVSRRKHGDTFVKLHPEFKDTIHNGQLMAHELKVRGRWPNPSLADFEEAYVSLADSKLITLDQAKINAARAKELDEQAAKIKAEAFDEEKAYAMPLNEVYRRGMGF